MFKTNISSSSTKDEAKAEVIIISLDSDEWMENNKSAMFLQQREAILYYCQLKFKNPRTIIGLLGSGGSVDQMRYNRIRPTRDLERIKFCIDGISVGGNIEIVKVAESALSVMSDYSQDMQKRLIFFAGGPLFCQLSKAELLGNLLKDQNIACDVISFGDPYMGKRQIFNTLIRLVDKDGNCNICHVPPESSVLHALSRSRIFIPRAEQSSSGLPQHDKDQAIVVYVNPLSSDGKTNCPVCQSVLLTLEEKRLRYNTEVIDLHQKPKWFKKANPYWTLPLIKFSDGRYVSNSEVILGMIEKMYPDPALEALPHLSCWGLRILPKIAAYLKTEDKNDKDWKAQDLLREIRRLDAHLENDGPFVNGKEIRSVDLSLAPKLYHLVYACKLTIPQDLPYLQCYTQMLFDRPSFRKTKPSIEDVVEGWCKRVRITKDKMPR